MTRVSPDWLALREPADAAARSTDLVDLLSDRLPGHRLEIHDLGSGTGSMSRWLAPRLPGPQHWVLYDRDLELLTRAAGRLSAADGTPVTIETRHCDIGLLTAADLDGASLITGSALLDMLTAAEIETIVRACARIPALLTLSVIGRVEFTPPDPLDASIEAAFNRHQRRTAGGRALFGPDAFDFAVDKFVEGGASVVTRASPWRLGADQADLTAEWFNGWIAAACEQQPESRAAMTAYAANRLAASAAGRLGVLVHHRDLLASHE